jgi:hypothetical protein
VPVLCEGTTRMTRAANNRTSEHGTNYFDSRLMSDKAMLQQQCSESSGKSEPPENLGQTVIRHIHP